MICRARCYLTQRLLLLLLLLAFLSIHYSFSIFVKGPLVQVARRGESLFVSRATARHVDLSLGQTFRTDRFLEIYTGTPGEVIRGVYAVEGRDGAVQYVGSSEDVRGAIVEHLSKRGPEKAYAIRVQTFGPDASNDLLEAYRTELLKQTNVADGDWEAATTPEALESPFAAELVIRPEGTTLLEFTKENIDKVLDEVRPYLIADGGNVAVVSIDDKTRSVSLVLQGACGSCASSTTTMKMGIERVLKENFSNLGEVISVDPASTSLLTVAMIEESLSKILPAIQGMGGVVEIRSADGTTGTVVIGYKGPARLRQGIELVLKDVTQVNNVIVEAI